MEKHNMSPNLLILILGGAGGPKEQGIHVPLFERSLSLETLMLPSTILSFRCHDRRKKRLRKTNFIDEEVRLM
jgi:hypothetical protein